MEITTVDPDFLALQAHARAAGLFEKTNGFYITQAIIILTLCAVSLGILVFVEGFWLRVVVNAVLLAGFASAQKGFLMHGVAHGQVFDSQLSPVWHTLIRAWFDFFLGSSMDWWIHKHNSGHHVDPNDPEKDPDIERMAFVSFTREYAEAKRGLYRITTRYQPFLLPFLLLFQVWNMRFAAAKHLYKEEPARAIAGFSLIGLHFIVYGGILFSLLPFWHALAFVFLHNGSMGLYLGLAFAVNHIGMPMFKRGEEPSGWQQQVLTSRDIHINIRGNERATRLANKALTVVMGGLNYQPGHHLCPEIPQPHLAKFTELVKRLCEKRGVKYHSVSPWQALCEVFRYMREIAQYARRNQFPKEVAL